MVLTELFLQVCSTDSRKGYKSDTSSAGKELGFLGLAIHPMRPVSSQNV